MTFGKHLKQLRERQGFTQRKLAGELGMDTAYLSRIENDYFNHLPARETIERIAAILKLGKDDSDKLHILAGKMPADIEKILFRNPELMKGIRRRGK